MIILMEFETKFVELFDSFIHDLSKTYPEIKSCLYRNYEECLTRDQGFDFQECKPLQDFIEIVESERRKISKKDERFFDKEDILMEISFRKLWDKNISNKTRQTIWKYFQGFSLLILKMNSSEALQALQGDDSLGTVDIDKDMASEMREIKRLAEGIQENTIDMDGAEADLDGMLGNMMDSNIGQIAKEVAETMDIESMFGSIDENSNPMELMSHLMNPEKMGGIFQNIQQVMDQKMERGDLSQDDLKREAEGMYGSMAKNPMFSSVMNQMGGLGQDGGLGQAGGLGQMSSDEPKPDLTPEQKKKALKDKIRQKHKERSGR